MSARSYAFGEFTLDVASRRLFRAGVAVPITVKAFDTLTALVERAGHVVEKDELMRRVWPDAIVEEANLSQQVFLVRKALQEHPKDHHFVATVPRRGYRFVADVVIRDTAAGGGTATDDQAATVPTAIVPPVLKLELPLSPGPPLAVGPCLPFALSPDGRTLVYVAGVGGTTALYVRRLDRPHAEPLPRTEGAGSPFFSPDGRWIGYFANERLRKIPATGGASIALCETGAECRGAVWVSDHEIVFAPTPASGLLRVPADGGRSRVLTTLDFASGERTHRWPDVLPGGREVLFTVARARSASFEEAELALVSLVTGERRTVHRLGSGARYLPTGHLAYMRGGSLMAVSFDPSVGTISGSAMPVVDAVMTQPTGVGYFACSRDGCLVYLTGEAHEFRQQLVWARDGSVTALPLSGRFIEEPRVSPDGRQIAVGIRQATSDIWIHDVEHGVGRRLTFDGDNFAPIWSPDGQRVTFSSNRNGSCQIFSQGLDDASPTLLVSGEHDLVPGAWHHEGRLLLFTEYNPTTGAAIWVCQPHEGTAPQRFTRPRGNCFAPAISPEGLRVAYTSDVSGRPEIHVVSLAEHAQDVQITTEGGTEPRWSSDGERLYFRRGGAIAVVPIDRATHRPSKTPVVVADGPYQSGSMTGLPNFDIAADGRLLLVSQCSAAVQPDRLSVTVHWFSELADRMA